MYLMTLSPYTVIIYISYTLIFLKNSLQVESRCDSFLCPHNTYVWQIVSIW
jgi:hypothetical protein